MRLIAVASVDLPELEPYRTLRESTRHWRSGFFVCEGRKVVLRLLASGYDVISVLLSRSWLEELRGTLEEERFGATEVYVAPDELLDGITGVVMHQKLIAIARRPPQAPDELFLRPGARTVAVEGIADAENMGSIVRNAAAFGADALLAGGGSCSPFLRRSVRVSMGAIFSLPVRLEEDFIVTLSAWKSKGLRLIATTPRGGCPRLRDCLDPGGSAPFAMLFGSEGEGLSPEALALCDARFSIPMQRGIDSINVAHTVALALYDLSLG